MWCTITKDKETDWSKPILTYAITKPTKQLSKNDLHFAFKYAFEQWSKIIPHKFKKLPWYLPNSAADILISFKCNSDNPQHLAHVSGDDGKICLNNARKWKKYNAGEALGSSDETDIISVAMREIQSLLHLNKIKESNSVFVSNGFSDAKNQIYILPTLKKIENVFFNDVNGTMLGPPTIYVIGPK